MKGQQNRHDMFISMMILWNHHFKMKKNAMRNKPVVIKLTKDNYNDYNLLDIVAISVAVFLTAGLIAGWLIAVAGIIFISERSDWKISLALVLPIITIPLSYIVLSIAFALLTVFNSCSSGFYGIIDPRFIQ